MSQVTSETAAVARAPAVSLPPFIVKIVDPAGSTEFLTAGRCRCGYEYGALVLRFAELDGSNPVELRCEGRGWHVFIMNAKGDTIEQIHGRARGAGGPPR